MKRNKISKSVVMKKAWQYFKSKLIKCETFSQALKRAWKTIKFEIEKVKRGIEEETGCMNEIMSKMADTISAAYASGCYMGD